MTNYQMNNQSVHMQQQPMPQKRNALQIALITIIVGIALIVVGGSANAIHRHIYIGEMNEMYAQNREGAEEDIKRYTDLNYEEKDKLIHHTKVYIEYIDVVKNSGTLAQFYNIIGIIVSIIASGVLLCFLFIGNKKMFKVAIVVAAFFAIVALWQFLTAFDNNFMHALESTKANTVFGNKKIVHQINPILATLYATLILAGWSAVLFAMYKAYKNADEIFAVKQQKNMLQQQQQFHQQMQQQFVGQQAPQQYTQQAPQPFMQQPQQTQAQPFAQQQSAQLENK